MIPALRDKPPDSMAVSGHFIDTFQSLLLNMHA
jgi:hypothetical protein